MTREEDALSDEKLCGPCIHRVVCLLRAAFQGTRMLRAIGNGWQCDDFMVSTTDARTLPGDVKQKLLAIREALLRQDIAEAWHKLYSIACPGFDEYRPWESLEVEKDSGSKCQ